MPPKAKITEDQIVAAALEIARETGAENINARTVARKLNCSTQPIMYHFKTIEQLKKAAYAAADQYHSEYLMNFKTPQEGMMLGMGLNYIRFAIEEPHLFRFLFQSGFTEENSLLEMISSEQLMPILSAMQTALNLDQAQTKEVFLNLAFIVHGYASLIANKVLKFDEQLISEHLKHACRGAVLAAGEEK